MSLGGWELLIVLLIILVIFGSKKLGSLGSDLGSAIKGFRGALRDEGKADDTVTAETSESNETTEDASKKS